MSRKGKTRNEAQKPARKFNVQTLHGAVNMPLLSLFVVFVGFWFDIAGVFRASVFSALFHELGHIICYCYIREDMPKIKITPVGFSMSVLPYELSVREEIWVAAMGPLFNFAMAGTFFIFASTSASYSAYICACVNLLVGTINLMPLPFLDGGRLLYLLFGITKSRTFWRYISNGFVCVLLAAVYAIFYFNSATLISKISLAAACIYALFKSLKFEH